MTFVEAANSLQAAENQLWLIQPLTTPVEESLPIAVFLRHRYAENRLLSLDWVPICPVIWFAELLEGS